MLTPRRLVILTLAAAFLFVGCAPEVIDSKAFDNKNDPTARLDSGNGHKADSGSVGTNTGKPDAGVQWPDSGSTTPGADSGSVNPPPTGGRTFGQKCGGAHGKCATGYMCVLFNESGKQEGYCTKECSSTKPCPTSPAGAQCAFKITSGKTICGFLCSAASPKCPAGLSCTLSKGGYHYCTTDAPAKCGNGKRELSEACDGKALNNLTCQALGYKGGTLKCTAGCKLDKSGCTGTATCGSLPARDCKSGTAACSKLELFSPFKGKGYNVTHGQAFSYLRHDTAMLVKYAAASVACMMPGSPGIGLGDMSMSNGGIPATNGQLRHPKGTHTYGRDIDIAYYQTGQPNNNLRSVCPHTSGGKEAYHCTGAPNILDVPRTTLFLAKIMESSRVRVIGVDGKIGPLVTSYAKTLHSKGMITSAAYSNFSKRLAYETTNKGMGWYYFHHHHLHLSTNTSSYSSNASPEPPMAPASLPEQPLSIWPELNLSSKDAPALNLDALSAAYQPDLPVMSLLR